jgi:glutathione S-transferase
MLSMRIALGFAKRQQSRQLSGFANWQFGCCAGGGVFGGGVVGGVVGVGVGAGVVGVVGELGVLGVVGVVFFFEPEPDDEDDDSSSSSEFDDDDDDDRLERFDEEPPYVSPSIGVGAHATETEPSAMTTPRIVDETTTDSRPVAFWLNMTIRASKRIRSLSPFFFPVTRACKESVRTVCASGRPDGGVISPSFLRDDLRVTKSMVWIFKTPVPGRWSRGDFQKFLCRRILPPEEFMSSESTLYGLNVSPWTERARWALDHHAVTYTYHEHLPMLGELLLRRKAGVKGKKASVPLFHDGESPVMGSFEIAKHAEKIGRGAPLFPRDRDEDVAHHNDLAERMTKVGRAWLLKRMMESKGAQAEALPPFMPGPLRSVLAPTSKMALSFLAKKHSVPSDVEAEVDRVLMPALEEIQERLSKQDGGNGNGVKYLLGTFSFADIAIAASLQVLRPRAESNLGPATKEAWTNDRAARKYEDLLDWRDKIYAKHR